MTPRPQLLLALSLGSILILTVAPTYGYRGHAHWERVQWIPFGERQLPLLDAAANVALFAPLGWALAMLAPRFWGLALIAAALLSTSVEAAQVFAHGRFPTSTDVVLNIAGAALGARLARRLQAPGGDP